MDLYGPVDSFNINYLVNSISKSTNDEPYLIFPSRDKFDATLNELKVINDKFIVPASLEDSIPENPALYKFESHFDGFYSLRMKIQRAIDSLSDLNIYQPDVFDPDDHFIGDEYYRTVLNRLMEVQINETVYKVLSTEWVAEFSAGDLSVLDFIRSFDLQDLDGTFDDTLINRVKFNYTGSVYNPAEGGPTSPVKRGCNLGIHWSEGTSGEITFDGTPQNGCAMTWIWGDGSQASTGIYAKHTYAKNGTYVVTLIAICGPNTCEFSQSVTVTTASSNSNCLNPPIADFVIEGADVGELRLTSNERNPAFWYHWEIKDYGISSTEQGVSTFARNFASQTTVEICLTIYDGKGCKSNKKCSTITISESCCKRGHEQVFDHKDFLGNHKMKYKIFRWNGGPFGRNVGAKSVHFEYRKRKFHLRRNPNKHWIRTKTKIYVKLYGQYWSGNRRLESLGFPCRYKFDIDLDEYKSNKCNADVTENPNELMSENHRIYTKQNRLNSSHWVLINGVYYGGDLVLSKCE